MRRVALALFAALAGCGNGAAQPVWSESATPEFRDGSHRWANPRGDWVDAAGTPLGAKPFATATYRYPTGGGVGVVTIDVTDLVRRHGADFRINGLEGIARFATRESPGGDGPVLEVQGPGGTRRLTAAADTEIRSDSKHPRGELPIMETKSGALIRFDQSADPAIRRATLRLTVTKVYGRTVQLLVFRPVLLDRPAQLSEGATLAPKIPDEAKNSKQAEQLVAGSPASAHRGGPGRTLLALAPSELKPKPGTEVRDGALVGAFERDSHVIISDVRALPGAPETAYMTVIMKLAPDFQGLGGKFPGLSNTGMRAPYEERCAVDGKPQWRGGWGGRPANGCRWSARTWWRTLADKSAAGGTYFYAVEPKNINGVTQVWSKPMPKGRWFAYVEWVKLNDPARSDGEVAYWLVDRQIAPGGAQVQSAGGIRWRTVGGPQSAINEVWVDIYCGGRDCGPAPWPRSEVRLKRVEVTTGLPDLGGLQAEVDRLNASG